MRKIIYVTLAFVPTLAFAQSTGTLGTFLDLSSQLAVIVRTLIPVAFGLGILFFFYGIAVYILSAGDAAKAKEGKSIMIYGVIAIAVMASLFGLVAWLQNAFGITPGPSSVTPPVVTGL